MRAFLIVIALVVLAGIGWFLFGATDTTTVTGDQAAPAAEATEQAAEATEQAAEEAAEATEDAADAATDAATDAAEATGEAAQEAAEGAADATAAAGDALTDALTVEGFDADRLREAVQASDISAEQKQAAEALIASAEQNPDQVQSVIEELRVILGL